MLNRKIVIRFDDICPSMNWTMWEKAKKVLDDAEVTALLGVIPDCKDPVLQIDEPREDFWEYVRKLQDEGYVIAMHGFHHVFDTKKRGITNKRFMSEFAGHCFDVQCEKIRKGKEIMEHHGIYTDVFFAPAHSYDVNTLKALAANGFKYMSDGLTEKPFMRCGIISVPARSNGIPHICSEGNFTAVVHAHEWVNQGKDAYKALKSLCENHKEEIVSFKDYQQLPLGNPILSLIEEKIRVNLRRHVIPQLVKIKRKLQ